MFKKLATGYSKSPLATIEIFVAVLGVFVLLFSSEYFLALGAVIVIIALSFLNEIHNTYLYSTQEASSYHSLEEILRLTCQTLRHKNHNMVDPIYINKQALVEGFFLFRKSVPENFNYQMTYKPFPPGTDYLANIRTVGYYCDEDTLLNYLFLTHPRSPGHQIVLTFDSSGFILDKGTALVSVFTVFSVLEELRTSYLNSDSSTRFRAKFLS